MTASSSGVPDSAPPEVVGPPDSGRPTTPVDWHAVVRDIASVLNRHGLESGSDTPDFILAEHLLRCLEAYDATIRRRREWYGRPEFPGSFLDREPLAVPDA